MKEVSEDKAFFVDYSVDLLLSEGRQSLGEDEVRLIPNGRGARRAEERVADEGTEFWDRTK